MEESIIAKHIRNALIMMLVAVLLSTAIATCTGNKKAERQKQWEESAKKKSEKNDVGKGLRGQGALLFRQNWAAFNF